VLASAGTVLISAERIGEERRESRAVSVVSILYGS